MVLRPNSGVSTRFAYEVRGTPADLEWLRSNIFGASDVGRVAADSFLRRVQALVPADRRGHARTYWLWPLYAWPNEAPVGLKDKTLLSLAWSVGSAVAASPHRRMLQVDGTPVLSAAATAVSAPHKEAHGAHIYDLYWRRINVQLPPGRWGAPGAPCWLAPY